MNWPYLVIIIRLRLCAGHDSGGGIRVTGAGNCSYVWTSCSISHNTAGEHGVLALCTPISLPLMQVMVVVVIDNK